VRRREPAQAGGVLRGEPAIDGRDPQHIGTLREEPALARPEIAERLGGRLDDAREKPAAGAKPFQRGGCSCLCEHLTALHPGAECDRPCEIETECGPIRADLHNGVPLACVTLARNDCGDWIFDTVFDACGPRRLVKRNDLLFDLIRGCDLTRISAIGWAAWHRSGQTVAWKDFEESLRGKEPLEQMHPNRYWVEFSRPVRKETVLLDCFSMTVIVQDDDSGWDQVLRVPIAEVTTWAREGTPEDHVTHAGLIVEDAWFDDEADTTKQYGGRAHKHSVFYEEEALVEIEVRGDYIVDCNGQTVDANAAGLRAAPTGNGTPGGTFLSTFRVAPMAPR
jgi:hypothetical protein